MPLNRVSGEDLDEKVTTKSGPGKGKWGATGGGVCSEQRNALRGKVSLALWKEEANWQEPSELKGDVSRGEGRGMRVKASF